LASIEGLVENNTDWIDCRSPIARFRIAPPREGVVMSLIYRPRPAASRRFRIQAACVVAGLLVSPAIGAGKEVPWPEIPEAERALTMIPQDPEADAVVLLNERHGRIDRRADDWVNIQRYHWRMKIFTQAGERFGNVTIPASRYSRVSNIRARTIKTDGTVVALGEDQVFEKVLYKAGAWKVSEWVFSFPAVEPGVIIEYTYDRHDNYILYLQPFYFDGPEYTLKARMTQGVLKQMAYSFLCEMCPAGASPTVSKWNEGKQKGEFYEIELNNLPGYREEMLMPPRREAGARAEMVLMRWKGMGTYGLGRLDDFFIDWASVARYVGTYYKRAVDQGLIWMKPELERWTEGIADPRARVEAVIRHVQRDFQGVNWRGITGWSRPVREIIESKVADDEEKAVLILTALRLLKVEVWPALTCGIDYGSVNPGFFSLSQFSHVVMALPDSEGKIEWIDPSIDWAPLGFGSWRDSGADALLVKGLEGELIKLPKTLERSSTRYEVTLKPAQNGQADLAIEVEFAGEDAIEKRERWASSAGSAREEDLREWIRETRPGAELLSHEFVNLGELGEPLRLKMTARAPGLVTVADGVILVSNCVLTCYTSNPVSHRKRIHPIYVDRGWNIKESLTIVPPEGMRAVEVPAPAVAKAGLGKLTLRCSQESGGSARCRTDFVAPRRRWHPNEVENLRLMFDRIVEADRGMVAFRAEEGEAGS
jgi:hypothetical protein